jgi:HK97 family phage major capsid protein
MNGVDVAKMRLLKTTPGDYLWASPDSALGVGSVWSVPLVISPSIAANNWLVGAFQRSTLLFQRQVFTVEIAYENEDDFVKNLSTIRAEERIASATPVPSGLVKGTFTTP